MKTSRQKTSVSKRVKPNFDTPYQISTRNTNRDYKMSESKMNENSGSSNSNAETVSNNDIAATNNFQESINFKLPSFWKYNPTAWIDLIESKFRIANIDTQIVKYVAVLESLDTTVIENLFKIPKPDDPECYEKLIFQLKDFFVRDNRDELDLLLNDLTLGDKTPNELMKHLIAVSGIENDPSPQFETVLKDKFLRALPSDIASSSGTWTYKNLRELAQCATDAMNAAQRYRKNSSQILATFSKHNSFNSQNKPKKNFAAPYASTNNRFPFPNRKPNHGFNNFNPTSNGRPYRYSNQLQSAKFYVCYYHRRFKQSAMKCEGPMCRFYSARLNCLGRQLQSLQ